MTELIDIIVKAFWCGCAAAGFGILFNAAKNVLVFLWVGGFLAGLVKFVFIDYLNSGIILGSFAAAVTVSLASIPVARLQRVPPMIYSITSVIPLVPGAVSYRSMLGLMRLTGNIGDEYPKILAETVHYSVVMLFVVMAIAIGTVIPMLIFDKKGR